MAAKPFVFATLMVLNIHVSQNVGFADSLKISVSTAHACPDEVDDCIVVTPDENDKIDTGSGGGGFVFDGGSGAGGGSVGSGNGGGSSGGNSGGSESSGTIDAKEQCQIAALEQKNQCLNVASGLFATASVGCFRLVALPAISLCEIAAVWALEDQKGNCELQFAIESARCD